MTTPNPEPAFAYDVVDYPSSALSQAHPGHLHAVARMFGCQPAPVDTCRVLELGGGDGTHLIAAAIALPNATFVGLDLSAAAIDRGNRIIAELGLRNVTLEVADVTAWEPPAEGFDYAIAHGLYSWVPPIVRDAVLRAFAAALAPTGIGYVSYNTYPGCYIRRMLWEMMKQHTADVPAPAGKMDQAAALARFVVAGMANKPDDPGFALVRHELREVIENDDRRVLYHDDLGVINDPMYFRDFVSHAAQFGFRFVAEAEAFVMETGGFTPEVAATLNGLAQQDVVKKEQYADFLRLRRFRQTLLAKDGRPPLTDPDPTALRTLAVSGQVKTEGTADLAPGVAVTFRSGKDAVARTDQPLGKAALVVLGECWPKRIPFPELANRAAAKLGRPEPSEPDLTTLAGLLAAVWMTGMLDLHGHIPEYTPTVSERPIACPFARIQARTNSRVTTRLHTTMHFDDAPSRRMVQLLDGTRTRDQIARDMAPAFPADKLPDAKTLRAGLEKHLERMAKGGLLVG